MSVEIRGKDTQHVVVSIDGKDTLRLTKSGPEWGTDNYYAQSEATKELMAWLRKHWRGEAPYERVSKHILHAIKFAFFLGAIAIISIVFVSLSWIMWTSPDAEGGIPAAIHWELAHQGIMLGLNGVLAMVWAGLSWVAFEALGEGDND